eukprot:TRINITY_DN2912_c0_g2_i1.p1 TRINITY_DN2912_c0_g2~~TRINITY_DN2912_c0_g2_i1.p1  ORF type:complete len:258 (+),score=101.11 TRINITY_DN2912_c0_g2_i1:40-774(+)
MSVRQMTSVSMTAEGILQAVRMKEEGRAMTLDRVRASLQQMVADPSGMVVKSTGDVMGPAHYTFQLGRAIDVAKMREMEAIIAQRFGAAACRIFRLLLLKKALEQKQVGEMAMVSLKEARELLYNMLKEEFLYLQEVAKTTDHAPQRTIYLWKVNVPTVMMKVLDDMCKAACNLRTRLAHEIEQQQEVISLLEQQQAAMAAGGTPPVMLTAAQRQDVENVRRIAAVLEVSLLRLDDAIMLFSNF